MTPHSSTLAWKILWTEEPGKLQSMGLLRVGNDWAISLSLFTFMHWRRKWQPTPVSCLKNPRNGGAWWAAVYGVAQSRTRLKQLSSSSGEGNGNPLQCSCLENPRNGGAWWAAVYGAAESRTRLKWLSTSQQHWPGGGNANSNTTIFLPGESHVQRSLAGSSPLGCKELDMTENTCIQERNGWKGFR